MGQLPGGIRKGKGLVGGVTEAGKFLSFPECTTWADTSNPNRPADPTPADLAGIRPHQRHDRQTNRRFERVRPPPHLRPTQTAHIDQPEWRIVILKCLPLLTRDRAFLAYGGAGAGVVTFDN